ncbi:hypothetical protein MKW98_028879 [Papaver atlanticum]|uniref:Uncharacterized protein n=1 Tax=Papaver atlanticum TaxID=357466 RepID=A0AAD4X758_9MAGN|nr:hypothetical protein MKW98_028879 [Papaver atlanticum]
MLDDPIGKRFASPPSNNISESNTGSAQDVALQSERDSNKEESPITELFRRLKISVPPSSEFGIIDELDDKEFQEIASSQCVVTGTWDLSADFDICTRKVNCQVILGALYGSYTFKPWLCNGGSDLPTLKTGTSGEEIYQFYHTKTASQLRMGDIPKLLTEYKQLVSK